MVSKKPETKALPQHLSKRWVPGQTHVNCRRKADPSYPSRLPVPDERALWAVPWKDYSPPSFTHPTVLSMDRTHTEGGWADPPDPQAADLLARFSHAGDIAFDSGGRPLNPGGRTGLAGRGVLGNWGPNHRADPIVTRRSPVRPQVLQMLVMRRLDNQSGKAPEGRKAAECALPTGNVGARGGVPAKLRAFFQMEAQRLPERSGLWGEGRTGACHDAVRAKGSVGRWERE